MTLHKSVPIIGSATAQCANQVGLYMPEKFALVGQRGAGDAEGEVDLTVIRSDSETDQVEHTSAGANLPTDERKGFDDFADCVEIGSRETHIAFNWRPVAGTGAHSSNARVSV